MIKAKIQKVSISAVKENDANPRFINKHKFKKVGIKKEWIVAGDIFKDEMTTAAAVDRLVHHSEILELNAKSYRAQKASKKVKKEEQNDTQDYCVTV